MRRPQADINLTVDGDSFAPGADVTVRATITSRKGFDVRNGQLSLECVETYWRMESNGKTSSARKRSRTIGGVSKQFMSEGRIQPSITHMEEATLTLPADAPPTVTGKHANLKWRLKLAIDVPGARDLSSEIPFAVVSHAGSDQVPGGDRSSSVFTDEAFDDCRLRIELPSGSFQPGSTITGRLRLDALKDCGFPEVRVELTRQEEAGVKKSRIVVEKAVLEKDAKYAANRSREWPFTLTIPEGCWPTMRVSSTCIAWGIRGILDRNRRRDFSIQREIEVI